MRVIATIEVDEATPFLRRAQAELQDRSGLNLYVARSVRNVTRDYLIDQAAGRHKTAEKLGARPTGHLARAAQSVDFEATKEAAIISIASAGISRAFAALTISPTGGKKYLTIPAVAEAYGKRAGEFAELKFVPLKGGKVPVLARIEKSDGGKRTLRVIYWLKDQVTVPEDRTLLPSDSLLLDAAEEGAREFLTDFITATDPP